MLNIRTRDDHDKRVPLAHQGMLAAFLVWRRSLTPLSFRTVPRLLRYILTGPLLACFGATAVLALIIGLFFHDSSTGFGMLVLSPVTVPLIAFGITASRGVLGLGGALPERMTRAMLAKRLCPSCAYVLSGAHAENLDLIVCPECGAAWHTEQLGADALRPPTEITIEGY